MNLPLPSSSGPPTNQASLIDYVFFYCLIYLCTTLYVKDRFFFLIYIFSSYLPQ